ncbi:DUF5805 domain-containing protein [Natronorubrum bangense]|uniref:Uncharacterized protein n=2 Tax=Natronorubrum bangense TaxID=61858 RepID=L9W3S6_9EURY|nr:DUF5805 domain-containing protein [Natronorubrum bangense]ELY44139.1 hypothetical protein C494_17133 [Natronorubrum bangense JCM 10635]QCC55634.1 hypothetical protein DV706_14865 [Natronorubrum bangense]
MADDDRVAVKTYVPQYQKEIWRAQADALEMSQSEFIRTMVQAGRQEFEIPSDQSSAGAPTGTESEPDDEFADRILEVLERNGVLGWDGLVEALIDDVEADLDAELQRLQDENTIRYSGREGGYVVTNHD